MIPGTMIPTIILGVMALGVLVDQRRLYKKVNELNACRKETGTKAASRKKKTVTASTKKPAAKKRPAKKTRPKTKSSGGGDFTPPGTQSV